MSKLLPGTRGWGGMQQQEETVPLSVVKVGVPLLFTSCGNEVSRLLKWKGGKSNGWAASPVPSPTTGCSPAPGQDCVNSRHTICRSLDLYKVVRLHQTGSGLQQSKNGLSLGMAEEQEHKGSPDLWILLWPLPHPPYNFLLREPGQSLQLHLP